MEGSPMTTRAASIQEGASEEERVAPFVRSRLFSNLFSGGMALVEETAAYLDDDGRKASRDLSREDALAYAGTSMRLTTRLMQIASWLLVLRAVREGEMTPHEARDEKYRIGPAERRPATDPAAGMPDELRRLIEQTDTLYARITRLDRDLFESPAPAPAAEDAAGQQQALRAAFGQD